MELLQLPAGEKVDTKKFHTRTPDIGVRLNVTLTDDEGHRCNYTAEYIGHGGSKTAFLLSGNRRDPSGKRRDPFHEKILKVTARPDTEPQIFTEFEQRCPDTTLKILYNAYGFVEGSKEVQYYCWITDRTIPLDLFLEDVPDVVHERCVLAVLLCCAVLCRNGLRLSDCGFQSFGVLVNKSEHGHCLLVIDAGSYELVEVDKLNKGFCNRHVANKIWTRAKWFKDRHWQSVRSVWQNAHDLPDVILKLHAEWMRCPYLTTQQQTSFDIEMHRQVQVLKDKQSKSRCYQQKHALQET